MVELMEAIQNEDFFKRSALMHQVAPRDPTRYCTYHRDNGHNIEDCHHLIKYVEEIVNAGKLDEFIKEYSPQSESKRPLRGHNFENSTKILQSSHSTKMEVEWRVIKYYNLHVENEPFA